jgi:hypothetical protein
MAGMGGGGAGVTALLARRSWLLVRGQRGVNGAADAAGARVGGTAKIHLRCRAGCQDGKTLQIEAPLGRRRGGLGIMAKGLLRLCWRRQRTAVVRLERLEVGGWGGGWVWDHNVLGLGQ